MKTLKIQNSNLMNTKTIKSTKISKTGNFKKMGYTMLAILALASTPSCIGHKTRKQEALREAAIQDSIQRAEKERLIRENVIRYEDSVAQVRYAEFRKKQIEDSIIFNSKIEMLNEIPFLKDVNKESLLKFAEQLKIKDFEYVVENDDITEIFAHTIDYTYDMLLGKTEDNAIAGIVSKESKKGDNELYLLRIDFIETNKSNKMKLSHMRVVQDGVSNDSETNKKYVSRSTINQTENINIATTRSGEVHKHVASAGGGFFSNGSEISIPEFIEKARTTSGVNTINSILLNELEDGRKITTYSMDKNTKAITKTGADITTTFSKAEKVDKYKDLVLVKGPYGMNIYINPKSLKVNENGVNLNSLNVEGLERKFRSMCCRGNYISSKSDLQRLYDICLDKLNDHTCQAGDQCTYTQNCKNILDALDQMLQRM